MIWRRWYPPEFGRIRPNWQVNANGRLAQRRVVVLLQPPPHLAGLDSNHGIIPRRVSGGTLEKLGSDRPFFKRFVVALQCVLDHVSQKLLASIAGAKERATENGFQFTKHSLFFRAVNRRRAMNLWVRVRERRRIHRTHSASISASRSRRDSVDGKSLALGGSGTYFFNPPKMATRRGIKGLASRVYCNTP